MPKKPVLIQVDPDLWDRAKDRAAILRQSPSVFTETAIKAALGELSSIELTEQTERASDVMRGVIATVSNYVSSSTTPILEQRGTDTPTMLDAGGRVLTTGHDASIPTRVLMGEEMNALAAYSPEKKKGRKK